jgi:hypothetical protein
MSAIYRRVFKNFKKFKKMKRWAVTTKEYKKRMEWKDLATSCLS